jgi:RHS repeat-associated protein
VKIIFISLSVIVCLTVGVASGATPQLDAQQYDLYTGDFTGDGQTDILYVAKDPSLPSGIAVPDANGNPTVSWQTWQSNYLGIQWSGNAYKIIVADFNGDGKADILLQSAAPGNSYLLLTSSSGKVVGISQTIPDSTMGLIWSADQHDIVAGDFNGDGRADIFLQATTPLGLNAVVLADSNGMFSASAPVQTWSDGYLGFNWSAEEANVFAGDFTGAGRADLLIQAKPSNVVVHSDVAFPVPTYPPNMNGIVLSEPTAPIFTAAGVQAWSRFSDGVDWSPLVNNIIIGTDSNNQAIVILQAINSGATSYQLVASKAGAVFSGGATSLGTTVPSEASGSRVLAGNFKGTSGIQLYSQPLMPTTSGSTSGSGGPVSGSSQSQSALAQVQPASAAGRTAGQFSVAANGSATYTIPLITPPGAGGAQLKLALSYNSRTPNGVMGVGWSVGGMSAITRCNKTVAQDGVAGSVTLQLSSTYSDRFCLDGMQLKLTSSSVNYGYANSTYATEIESFSLIQAGSAMIGNGPASFTVTSKNGLIYTYGGTTDSEVLAGTSGTIRTWALSQIADRVGNKISLVYQQSTGTYRIDHILYPTTAGGQGPYYEVLFTYGARPSNDLPSSYVDGYAVSEPNQLNSISTMEYPGGTVIKQYDLIYTQSATTNRNMLTSLQECSASTCLTPTYVTYQGQSGAQGWSATTIQLTTTGTPTFADLNGDGLPDAVYQDTSGIIFVQFQTSTGFGSYVSTGVSGSPMTSGSFLGNGSQQIIYSVGGQQLGVLSYSGGSFSTSLLSPLSANVSAVTAADIDGDGLDDLIVCSGGSLYGTCLLQSLHNTTQPPGAARFGSPFTIWPNQPSSWKIIVPGGPYGYFGFSSLQRADFNGDGRADILVVTAYGTQGQLYATPLQSNGANAAFTALTSFAFNTGDNKGSGIAAPTLTDWNGDGCTDVVTPNANFTYILVEVSNCAGGFTPITTNLVPGTASVLGTADYDGDGRQDLLFDAGDGTAHVLLSTGTGYGANIQLGLPAFADGSNNHLYVVSQIADLNNDGAAGIYYFNYSSGSPPYTVTYYPHKSLSTPPDLANSFTDGFGMNQSPTYVPLSNSTYYTKGTTAVFPEKDYVPPLYVVNQFTASDGTGNTYQDQFFYWGARAQVQGRGFEGLSERRTYDTRNSLYTYDYFEQSFPYTGMPFQQVLSNSAHNLGEWTSTPNYQLLTGLGGYQSRWFRYLSPEITTLWETTGPKDGDQIFQSTKTTTYGDGYGNPTVVVTSTTDQDSTAPASPFNGQTWTQTINASYYNDSTHNCFGLPDTLSDQRVVPGQTTQTRNFSYLADTTKCRTTQETIEPNVSGLQVTIAYGFDDTCTTGGNTVAVTGQNPDGSAMATRTTTYDFSYTGQRCQLVEAIINPAGETTSIWYNYDFGVPRSVTDPNDLFVSYQQDDYGRKNYELRPDGTYSTTTYSSCSAGPCWGYTDLRFLSIDSEYGSDQSFINQHNKYYDGFNRIRGELSYRANGLNQPTVWTYDALHSYDSLGRQTQLLRPYSSASNGYSQWMYDALNRVTYAELYQPNGTLDRTTQTKYLGRTIQTIDPRINTVNRVTDVTGKLREVIDPAPGGTTQYFFDVFGNPNQTIDAIGATSSATFNLRGFRTQMVDADEGTWNYKGDSLNELVSWQDAKLQSFSAIYDPLGRMTSRTEPEGTSTWTWGSTPSLYNVDKLAAVSGYGYTENLTYDSAGRLAGRQIVSDQTYQYSYQYNPQGMLSTVSYPASPPPTGTTAANYTIQYTYSAGEPIEIQNITGGLAVPLWTSNLETDSRLTAAEVLSTGSGAVTVTTGYKVWTDEILSIQSGSGGSTTNLQNLGYTWDTTGNLTQRGDANQAGTCTVNGNSSKLCEAFAPDALNRLSSSTLNGVGNLSIGYDAAGDITSKSDVGTYTYPAPTAPHAHGATMAGSNSYSFDANGNVSTKNGLTQTWASYNLPTILQGAPSGTTFADQFSYGPEHNRYREVSSFSDGTETTMFIGDDLEKMTSSLTGITYWRHYITTPSGQHGIISRNSDGSTSANIVLTDHLGSSDEIVNGATGALLFQESYGAFGQRRQTNWTAGIPSYFYQTALTEDTRRGFTFHEQLDGVGFIHMNGRVYDPTVGRFMSVDPITGDGIDSQRVNPYVYVSNRPLVSMDPTGLDSEEDNKEAPGGQQPVSPQMYNPGTIIILIGETKDAFLNSIGYGSSKAGGSTAGVGGNVNADSSTNQNSAQAGAGVPPSPGANGADKGSSPTDLVRGLLVETDRTFGRILDAENQAIKGTFELIHVESVIQFHLTVIGSRILTNYAIDHPIEAASWVALPEVDILKLTVIGTRAAARAAVGIGEHAGESIAARSAARDFTAAERANINKIGSKTGCHTCGTRTPGTKSGNFVPDHQPPSALNPEGAPQSLYPQCINCSRQQGLDIARQLQDGTP